MNHLPTEDFATDKAKTDHCEVARTAAELLDVGVEEVAADDGGAARLAGQAGQLRPLARQEEPVSWFSLQRQLHSCPVTHCTHQG